MAKPVSPHPADSAGIDLRIVGHFESTAQVLRYDAMGFAVPPDTIAISLESVDKLASLGIAEGYQVLGGAMAHEIGHLFLGANSHSAVGIMRAGWKEQGLTEASQARLNFMPDQAVRIRAEVRHRQEQQQTASASTLAQPDAPPPRLTLTIQVFNYAKVSAGRLRGAEGEAARIIGEAGVRTVWLDCPTSGRVSLPAPGGDQQECSGEPLGATVILRVLNRSDYDGATLSREVFGYADGPALASVLYDRVAGLAYADGDMNEAAVILGDAMAHEIGHLLLGPRAHSPTGIMRGQWDRAQFQRALKGLQRFTPDQSASIRAAMEARMKL